MEYSPSNNLAYLDFIVNVISVNSFTSETIKLIYCSNEYYFLIKKGAESLNSTPFHSNIYQKIAFIVPTYQLQNHKSCTSVLRHFCRRLPDRS